MSVVNFKHFARNKYSELIRLESCFLGIIFFTSKFPGNSVPNEYFKLLLLKNVMMLVRNKPCKSSTKSNFSFLKYLINEKSIFIKLRKDPFLNRFFKSAFGNSSTLSSNGSWETRSAKLGSISQLIFALGYVFFNDDRSGRQKTISPIEEVRIIRILTSITLKA